VIVAGEDADPAIVAADLVSQLEWDADALGAVVTLSDRTARRIDSRVKAAVRRLPRNHPAREALRRWSAILVARTLDEALETVNRIAPARAELLLPEPLGAADRIEAAGVVVMGPWTPPALATPGAGVARVVPTLGSAAVRGPLGVHDFVRATALVRVAPGQFPSLAATARTLASLEGLPLSEEALTAGARGER